MSMMYSNEFINCSRDDLLGELRKQIKPSRFAHVLRVEETALKIAEPLGVNLEKVSIAALMHDFAKEMDDQAMFHLAFAYWPNEALKTATGDIWHGPAAAQICRTDFNCQDESILKAIAGHTTGWFEMDQLAKIIYMADYIEPGRDFKGVKKARRLTGENLTEACEYKMIRTINYLLKQRVAIFTGTIDIYNAWVSTQESSI